MIPLLEKLKTWRENAEPLLDRRSAKLLEWPAVANQIAAFCRNQRAAAVVSAREPLVAPLLVKQTHDLLDEMRCLDQDRSGVPFVNVGAVLELLQRPAPMRLEGEDLVQVAALAEDLDVFRNFLTGRRHECPVWGEAAVAMAPHAGVSGAVRRALDPDGRITDHASPLLARLRKQAVEAERAVRKEITVAMNKARKAGWTTGDEVTLRGDRFCVPLRSGDSARLPGIVHDRSATGATLFVEPAQVVGPANALVEVRWDIVAEEARILLELNRVVERAASSLCEGMELMLLADETRAVMAWSEAVGGSRPVLDDSGRMRISGGRHPLLIDALGRSNQTGREKVGLAAALAEGRKKVVPLELDLPPVCQALVISGPNAGGKSVALKTVGVFYALVWCGWDVPARDDTILPRIHRVLADLGDDQSISAALSSFSAHLGHLHDFLDLADDSTLVLCDEIGSGTDPQEGTALAYAVLEQLVAQGARVMASTHYGLLKAAVHDHVGMLNAAMEFNEQDLQPLFTLRVGDPGTSHAFDIAARMGLPEGLLTRARKMAGTERVQVEKLLTDLDRRARELRDTRHQLDLETNRLANLNRELEKRLKGIGKERLEVLAKTRQEGERFVREGRRAIENAVREIKSSGADKAVVRTARDRIQRLGPQDSQTTASRPPIPILVGQRVRIPHLNLIGKVMEVRGGRIVALAEGLRLTLGEDAVKPLAMEGSQEKPSGQSDAESVAEGAWSWQGEAPAVAPEIDLRGMQGEEAWTHLDRLIDRAIPVGLEVLQVIHGFGTGRLRDYLYNQLKRDSRVATFTEAGQGRGGGGATLVYLADS